MPIPLSTATSFVLFFQRLFLDNYTAEQNFVMASFSVSVRPDYDLYVTCLYVTCSKELYLKSIQKPPLVSCAEHHCTFSTCIRWHVHVTLLVNQLHWLLLNF